MIEKTHTRTTENKTPTQADIRYAFDALGRIDKKEWREAIFDLDMDAEGWRPVDIRHVLVLTKKLTTTYLLVELVLNQMVAEGKLTNHEGRYLQT